jgi:hypothetical protein
MDKRVGGQRERVGPRFSFFANLRGIRLSHDTVGQAGEIRHLRSGTGFP